ncbi:MAG: rRNA maturation RNase YbeY [Rhabdochlamydiaceae bacterium]|nr:rRNA maturation RNase YbeY [Rhabdochlamydiaceae bacterium]
MKVTLYNQQRDLPISQHSVKRLISCLSEILNIESDELVLHFISDSKMKKLHLDFFNDPSSTDCISFPLCPSDPKRTTFSVLGEVFVCPKVAIAYAIEHALDPYEEASRYVIHGILHLLGYDDLEPKEKRKMRAQENRCLKLLSRQGALLKQLQSL